MCNSNLFKKGKNNFLKIILLIIIIITTLFFFNFNDINDITNMPKYIQENIKNYFSKNNISEKTMIPVVDYNKCPKNSCETGRCCYENDFDSSIKTNIETIAVLTYDYCECPNDTYFSGTFDNISTPEIIWKICNCK